MKQGASGEVGQPGVQSGKIGTGTVGEETILGIWVAMLKRVRVRSRAEA